MATVQNSIDALEAELRSAVKRIQDTQASLQSRVDALAADSKVANDPSLAQRLDDLTTLVKAIDPTDPTVLPDAGPGPSAPSTTTPSSTPPPTSGSPTP